MSRLSSLWEHFQGHVLKPDATEEERMNARATFYAGAHMCFALMTDQMHPTPSTEIDAEITYEMAAFRVYWEARRNP